MKMTWIAALSAFSVAPAALANPVVDFVFPPANAVVIVPEPPMLGLLIAGGVAAGVVKYIKSRKKN